MAREGRSGHPGLGIANSTYPLHPRVSTTHYIIDMNILNRLSELFTGTKQHVVATPQQPMIYTHTLPLEGDWDVLKRWGIIQGPALNDLFCECVLPPGWSKTTSMGYWTDLLDSRGISRAAIFDKAIMYAPAANVYTHKRFTLGSVPTDWNATPQPYQHREVRDNGLSRMNGKHPHVVFRDEAVYCGTHSGQLVAVKGDRVYRLLKGVLVHQWDDIIPPHEVTLLTRQEFYREWYTADPSVSRYLEVVEDLAMYECEQYLSHLPTDDSVWGPEYDYPHVGGSHD